MKRLLAALTGVALLALPAGAAAAVDITSVNAGDYPRTQATVVTAKPTRLPPELTENGLPATGLVADNLGAEKSVVLLVDNSQSMKGAALKNAIAAARAFVADKGLNDKIAVIAFGHKAVELTELSASGSDASGALGGIKLDSQPGTALFDAIALGAKQLSAQQTGGKVILLVTDGKDVSSDASFPDAVKAAHEAGALVYGIGISGPQFSPGTLRSLTQKTGGGYRTASAKNLGTVYDAIANELRNTWRMDFITAARPGETRKLVAYVPGQGRAKSEFTIPESASIGARVGCSRLLPTAAAESPGSVCSSRYSRCWATPSLSPRRTPTACA